MRTVVFSNESVAKRVNASFVSSWKNVAPAAKFQDGIWSKLDAKFYERYALGNGVTNVTVIFALADGTVLNAVPGYLDVGAFEAEMEFALEVAKKVKERPSEAAKILQAAHRAQAKVERGPYAAKAHERLAGTEGLTIESMPAKYFEDFQKRNGG